MWLATWLTELRVFFIFLRLLCIPFELFFSHHYDFFHGSRRPQSGMRSANAALPERGAPGGPGTGDFRDTSTSKPLQKECRSWGAAGPGTCPLSGTVHRPGAAPGLSSRRFCGVFASCPSSSERRVGPAGSSVTPPTFASKTLCDARKRKWKTKREQEGGRPAGARGAWPCSGRRLSRRRSGANPCPVHRVSVAVTEVHRSLPARRASRPAAARLARVPVRALPGSSGASALCVRRGFSGRSRFRPRETVPPPCGRAFQTRGWGGKRRKTYKILLQESASPVCVMVTLLCARAVNS